MEEINIEEFEHYANTVDYLRDEDVVFVSGSIVEGIGNKYSDFDIYVVTDKLRLPSDFNLSNHHRMFGVDKEVIHSTSVLQHVRLLHTVIHNTGQKIDVEFRTRREIQSVEESVEELAEHSKVSLMSLSKRIPVRDEMLVHRILSGVSLKNPTPFLEIGSSIDRARYCYLAYRWLASDFSFVLDIFGALDNDEIDRAVDLSRENLKRQMLAFLHLNGVTNTNPKWIFTYLNRSKEVDQTIKDQFLQMFSRYNFESERSRIEFVYRSFEFCDQLYQQSVSLLERNEFAPSGAEALDQLKTEYETMDQSNEYAQMEFNFRSKVYRQGYDKPTVSLFLN